MNENEEINERERLCGLYGEEVVRAAEALAGYGISVADLMEAVQRILNAMCGAWESTCESLKKLFEQVQDILFVPRQSKLERKWLAQRRTADRQKSRVRSKLYNERVSLFTAQRQYRPP